MAPNPTDSFAQSDKKYSRIYAESDGDEIVISGMAGRFPNCRNVQEYEYNLYNKIDMVDDAETRWKHFNSEIPRRSGKMLDIEKFDAPFFAVHSKQAQAMDPQGRILLETAFECVLDAGICPKTIRGSRTGVYIGSCIAEAEKVFFYESVSNGLALTGCCRSMLPNRISYSLDLTGPSHLVNTSCSSSMYALDLAFTAFRNGEIDAAIVGGANLLLHPNVTLQFTRLGVLSPDGFCRPFDKDASGYTRSESINCIFLQRRRDAKRVYCTVVYSETNSAGFKAEGITHPSSRLQEKLLNDFYAKVPVNMNDLGYLEAHGTGTIMDDAEECHAVDNAICSKRDKPLLIGSVKSNVGHAGGASGINSIVKVCLAFHHGKVAPNINFTSPKTTISSLKERRMQVVTEVQKLESPYIAINSFGLGGTNAHILVKGHMKAKINNGVPKDGLPRLVNFAGRTKDTVTKVFNSICERPLDAEYVGLLHNIQTDDLQSLVYRGYGLFAHEEGQNAQCIVEDVQHFTWTRRPIVFVFSGMGSQWPEMGRSLMNLPMFRESIERCHKALLPEGLDLFNILTSPDTKTFDNILHSFVGIAACQIAIVDILRALNIEADYYIGHSVGELGCGYADGGFTPEQMILSSYSRGMVSLEAEKIKGSMAAVGLGFKEIIKILPPTIEVACHNSQDSSTISGPAADIEKFVAELRAKSVFAKEVPCSNIAYHSRYIAQMGPALLKRLKEVIPQPKKRSQKWLSTSVPKSRWEAVESQYCSAEYHTNNLLRSVLFEETASMLPENAVTIEIAPHGLLQPILKRSMPKGVHIGLTQRGNNNNMNFFLTALGKLFINGVTMRIDRLYPAVDFPVSQGTPMISSLLKWDHSQTWYVGTYGDMNSNQRGEKSYQIGIKTDSDKYLEGHTIDGNLLVPPAAYLLYVWETLCLMRHGPSFIDMPVEFEDVRFIRAIQVSKADIVTLTVVIHYGTGQFEITKNRAVVVCGTVREIEYEPPTDLPSAGPSNSPILNTRDFYKELRLRGYHYGGAFRSVQEAQTDGAHAKIKWDHNWVTFIDGIMQINFIGKDTRDLYLPTHIRKFRVNGKYHYDLISKQNPENVSFEVRRSKELDMFVCGGVELTGMKVNPISRRRSPGVQVLERYQFIPHFPAPLLDESDAIRCCVQLIIENHSMTKLKIVEDDSTNCADQIIEHFISTIDNLPLIVGMYSFLTNKNIKVPGVHVENSKLSRQKNCNIIIAKNVINNNEYLEQVLQSLAENGFLLARERAGLKSDDIQMPSDFRRYAVFPTEKETLILMMRLKNKFYGKPTVVKVSEDNNFQWVEKVKTDQTEGPVLVVAQNEKFTGTLGLVKCLQKETDGHLITCMIINDPSAPPFDQEHPFYKKQLKMEMAINILKDGKWGTYRYLQLKQEIIEKPQIGFIEANIRTIGDLSSLSWFETAPSKKYANCIYASLNFRDVMLATGRLRIEDWTRLNRKELANILGCEYVGVRPDGKRVMVMVPFGAMKLYGEEKTSVEIEIPDKMSMQDAATILVAYLTVYYAFFGKVDIRKGKSILIHSGAGDVGLAAIRVALAYGLEVFTTCSTNEKKQYLLNTFPQLKECHIGYSRDTSFKKMVMLQTKGKGVDFVLNSLSGDKLAASLQCVGVQGHFLEIGKFDIENHTTVGMGAFINEISFHVITPGKLFYMSDDKKKFYTDMISRDLERGIIKPLPSTVFKANELEKAFRYLASGRHIGKVIIQIREDENSTCSLPIKVMPIIFFDPNLAYIILGGLSGFGTELADWMILRGAMKIVLSSSRGVTRSHQKYKLHLWNTSYKTNVVLSTADIATRDGCEKLLQEASELGQIGGIFNLALMLQQDAVFQNQTAKKFKESFAPKAISTKYLDELSRKLCPNLVHFVVFASITCGKGNAGQTNYGMANAAMERIIEDRVANGLPGKIIQWGAIGEGELLADVDEENIDFEVGGTVQQRISSCLQELDRLLRSPDPFVASMFVAEKRSAACKAENVVRSVLNILGIKDFKSIPIGATFSEMGMNTLMASEIKTILERECNFSISLEDLRTLTFENLKDFDFDVRQKENCEEVKLSLIANSNIVGFNLLIRDLGDEQNSNKSIVHLPTKSEGCIGNPIIVLPGVEGVGGQAWREIFKELSSKAILLQFNHTAHITSLKDIADIVLEDTIQHINKREVFYIVSYSFSTLIALEMAKRLEKAGYRGQLLFIDGAPQFLNKLFCQFTEENSTDDDILNMIFTGIANRIFPDETDDSLLFLFSPLEGWDKKIEKFAEYVENQKLYSKDYSSKMIKAIFNRIKLAMEYDVEAIERINSPITLVRCSQVPFMDIEEDYELSKITKGKVSLSFIDGDHVTMLHNKKLAQIINETHPAVAQDTEFLSMIENMQSKN